MPVPRPAHLKELPLKLNLTRRPPRLIPVAPAPPPAPPIARPFPHGHPLAPGLTRQPPRPPRLLAPSTRVPINIPRAKGGPLTRVVRPLRRVPLLRRIPALLQRVPAGRLLGVLGTVGLIGDVLELARPGVNDWLTDGWRGRRRAGEPNPTDYVVPGLTPGQKYVINASWWGGTGDNCRGGYQSAQRVVTAPVRLNTPPTCVAFVSKGLRDLTINGEVVSGNRGHLLPRPDGNPNPNAVVIGTASPSVSGIPAAPTLQPYPNTAQPIPGTAPTGAPSRGVPALPDAPPVESPKLPVPFPLPLPLPGGQPITLPVPIPGTGPNPDPGPDPDPDGEGEGGEPPDNPDVCFDDPCLAYLRRKLDQMGPQEERTVEIEFPLVSCENGEVMEGSFSLDVKLEQLPDALMGVSTLNRMGEAVRNQCKPTPELLRRSEGSRQFGSNSEVEDFSFSNPGLTHIQVDFVAVSASINYYRSGADSSLSQGRFGHYSLLYKIGDSPVFPGETSAIHFRSLSIPIQESIRSAIVGIRLTAPPGSTAEVFSISQEL